MSIKDGSVIISRIDSGLALPDPFRLTTGISDAEPWLSFPSGIDVEYRLFEDNRTGGRPYEFICSFIFGLDRCYY